MYFKHFTYNGITSKTKNVIAVSIDGFYESESETLGMVSNTQTIQSAYNSKSYISSQKYSEPTSFKLVICNSDFSRITIQRERELKKWLMTEQEFNLFSIEDLIESNGSVVNEYDGIYWNVNMSNPELFKNGDKYGIKFDCICDSGFAYGSEITKTYTFSEPENNTWNSFNIEVDSDGKQYIYPKVKITISPKPDGVTADEIAEIIINNSSELDASHRQFKVKHMYYNEVLNVDCEKPQITTSRVGHQTSLFNDFDGKHWIRLRDGDNILSANHACSIELKYREWIGVELPI